MRSVDEAERNEAVLGCSVLDTAPEPELDELTALAASICGVPVALVSLIDRDRQWVKTRVGLEIEEIPRDLDFCAHTILSPKVMVVGDTLLDPRFEDHPLVADEPKIRFYAGAPLLLSGGTPIGALCVMDHVPRTLDASQLRALEALARQAASQLELQGAVRAIQVSEKRLRASEKRLVEAQRVAGVGSWEWDARSDVVTWSDELYRLLGASPKDFEPSLERFLDLVHADDRDRVARAIDEAFASGRPLADRFRVNVEGAVRTILAHGEVCIGEEGRVELMRGTAQDVTAHREAEERYEFLAEIIPQQVWTALPDGSLDYVNTRALDFFGRELEWVLGSGWMEVVHPEDLPRATECWSNSLATGAPFEIEFRLRAADGSYRWHIGRALPLRDADGQIVKWFGTNTDISEYKALLESLRHQAERDDLTDLFNRRRFEAELARAIDDAERYGGRGAVLMLDLDHFKLVNDSLGHNAGDAVIREFAVAFKRRLRSTDVLARLGGDEFAVLMPEASEREARVLADRLLDSVRDRGTTLRMTASAGIALYDGNTATTAEDILVAADIALYEAKGEGRNRAVLSAGLRGGALTWVEKIRAALDEDRFVLAAQPILDLREGRVDREELLVRMLDEDGAAIAPGAFLPVAESFGLIQEIDRWVVSRALRYASEEGRRVQVNLSARSIGDKGMSRTIETVLKDTGLDPELVIFEVTETAATSDVGTAMKFADRMTALGCGLALDDFGTGFGSFTYLKNLPVGHLKIDMEFVRELSRSVTDRRIVQAIVTVAKGLGQKTIGEGVEDAHTLESLRKLGVDYAQGYHIGRPALIDTGSRVASSA